MNLDTLGTTSYLEVRWGKEGDSESTRYQLSDMTRATQEVLDRRKLDQDVRLVAVSVVEIHV